MMRDLPAIWTSATSQINNTMARTMMKNLVFFSPLFHVIIAYYMFHRSGLPGIGEYVIVGSGMMTLWSTILWSSATDIGRERWMGTFELILISPVPFPTILLGKILGNTILSLLALALTYIYSRVLLGVEFVVANPLQLLMTLVVSIFSFVGFSLMLALLFTLSRQANNVANGLSYPIFLVSGLLFPLTSLPAWLLPVGLGMPLAWARESFRWAVVGAEAAQHLVTPSWLWAATGLLIVGVIYYTLAFVLYRYVVERRIRQMGQLGVS